MPGMTGRGKAGESWQEGDLVIALDGALWVRAYEEDEVKGWPWGYPGETARSFTGGAAGVSGSVPEDVPVRPLTLLVRNGRPYSPVEDQALSAAQAVGSGGLYFPAAVLRPDVPGPAAAKVWTALSDDVVVVDAPGMAAALGAGDLVARLLAWHNTEPA